MALHDQLRTLVATRGRSIFDNAEELRGALDDFLSEEDATTGQLNLLVDAVRLGAFDRMVSLLDQGATAADAVDEASTGLTRDRETDPERSRWALTVLGYAIDRLGPDLSRQALSPPTSLAPLPAAEERPVESTPAPAEAPPTERAVEGSAPPPSPPLRNAVPEQSSGRLGLGLVVVAVLVIVGALAFVLLGDEDPTSGPEGNGGPTTLTTLPTLTSGERCGGKSYASSASVASTSYGVVGVRAEGTTCPIAIDVALASEGFGGGPYSFENFECIAGEKVKLGVWNYACSSDDDPPGVITFTTAGNG